MLVSGWKDLAWLCNRRCMRLNVKARVRHSRTASSPVDIEASKKKSIKKPNLIETNLVLEIIR